MASLRSAAPPDSYRPSLPLRYIASTLGFLDTTEAHDFLKAHGVALYIEPTPAEVAASATNSSGAAVNGGRRKKGQGGGLPLEERKWDCKSALPGVLAAGDKYRKIDIKGQI